MRTRVGYTGGEKEHPTYRDLGGHSEAIQIDYDPEKISYSELLDVYWESHTPTLQIWSQQYRSAIFTHSGEQDRIARASHEATAARLGAKIYTEVEPLGTFWRAEDYHQKYQLRKHDTLVRDLERSDPSGLTDSTAAARINGYLAGWGDRDRLEDEIDSFDLSAEGRTLLRAAVGEDRGASDRSASGRPAR